MKKGDIVLWPSVRDRKVYCIGRVKRIEGVVVVIYGVDGIEEGEFFYHVKVIMSKTQ